MRSRPILLVKVPVTIDTVERLTFNKPFLSFHDQEQGALRLSREEERPYHIEETYVFSVAMDAALDD